MSVAGSYYEKQMALWAVRGRDRIKSARLKDAISKSKKNIGIDIAVPEMRARLIRAVLLNCDDRSKYPYRMLNIDFVSERDFYRRKDKFLQDVYTNFFKF